MAFMDDVEANIADKVRGAAAEKHRDQGDIAKLLGLSRQAVNQRMNAKVPFSGAELYRLTVALQVPLSRLFPTDSERGVVAA